MSLPHRATSHAVQRVVVADSDADVRARYRQALDQECDVVEAIDGREALTKALVRVPALIFTELRLPLIDGYTLCEILRRNRSTATVPIVVVTREARSWKHERARQLGVNAVLVKPISSDTFLAEVRRWRTYAEELRRT